MEVIIKRMDAEGHEMWTRHVYRDQPTINNDSNQTDCIVQI